jgi:hypothetical protein
MSPDNEKRLVEAAESTAAQIARVGDLLHDSKAEIIRIGQELAAGGDYLLKRIAEATDRFGL